MEQLRHIIEPEMLMNLSENQCYVLRRIINTALPVLKGFENDEEVIESLALKDSDFISLMFGTYFLPMEEKILID
jgi:hypothetical protein